MEQATEQLRGLIKDRYRTIAAFADAVGIPSRTIYSILKGEGISNCSFRTGMAIAEALELDPHAFAQGRIELAGSTGEAALAPVFDEVAPGVASAPQSRFPVPKALLQANPDAFMLRVHGNGMNTVLPDGFLALVAPCDGFEATNGLYAVSVDGAPATIRRVILHDNGFTLEPESTDPTYRPLLVMPAGPDAPDVIPIGQVVWYCPPTDRSTA